MRAMIEVVGPVDTHPDMSHMRRHKYREDRGLADIEEELRAVRLEFSFEDTIRRLARAFPNKPVLEVLDAGCGDGVASGEFRALGSTIGREIRVTGVTMGQRNVPTASERTDTLLVGSVVNAFLAGKIERRQFAFILDFCGDGFYDRDTNPLHEARHPDGWRVVPVYGQVLAPGGMALLSLLSLSPLAPAWGATHEGMADLLASQRLKTRKLSSVYAVVEKMKV